MSWEDWRSSQESVRMTVEDGFEEHEFSVAYREIGEGEPFTLFLHGLPTWGYLWRNIHDAVDHALIPDLAGFGFTEHVSNQESYSRSIRFQEEFIKKFLEKLDVDSVQIVGHDWGGAAATRLAVHFPDMVDKMVLSSIACYDNFPLENIHGLGLPRSVSDDTHLWREMDWETLDDELTYIFEGTYGDKNEEFIEGMKAPFLEHPSGDVIRLNKDAISANTNNTLEISNKYKEISSKTQLIWASDDLIVPKYWAKELAEDIPETEEVYLDNSYHWVPEDKPEEFRETVQEFLN